MRTIYSLTVEKDQNSMITIRISGSGFLYNMVRIIAGTLIKVGMGVYPPEHVEEILYARDRQAAGGTAPAKGLTLISLEYEKELPRWGEGHNLSLIHILIVMLLAGCLGYLMNQSGYPTAPLVLAIVLSKIFETNLRRAFLMSGGNPVIFFKQPLSAVFMCILIILIMAPVTREIWNKVKGRK